MKNADKPIYPTTGSRTSDSSSLELKRDGYKFGGLTKREEFARTAMLGIIHLNPVNIRSNIGIPNPELAAIYALEYADNLLKKLEQ